MRAYRLAGWKQGGEFAEVFAEDRRSQSASLDDGKVAGNRRTDCESPRQLHARIRRSPGHRSRLDPITVEDEVQAGTRPELDQPHRKRMVLEGQIGRAHV